MISHFIWVQLLATLWTIARKAPLSMGFSKQEYCSGLPCSSPGDLPDSGIELTSLMSLAFGGRFFTTSTTWEALLDACESEVAQSCPTLCNPMDYSPPGSCVHGILWARILEWVAMLFSRGSSWPRDPTLVSYVSCIGRWVLYHLHHLGSCSQVERVEISRGKQAMPVSIVAFFNIALSSKL